MRSFENAFEPSRIAAFFLGPNTRSPAFSNLSTIPPTSGSSIPIIVKSISFSLAYATSLSNSITPIGAHSTTLGTVAIPALPGATYISSTLLLFDTEFVMACSLPPPPTIKTFIIFPFKVAIFISFLLCRLRLQFFHLQYNQLLLVK